MNKLTIENLPNKLKILRIQKQLPQKTVAKTLGITLSAYSNYEQGIREPSNEVLIKICQYFCVSADYLLGLEN